MQPINRIAEPAAGETISEPATVEAAGHFNISKEIVPNNLRIAESKMSRKT